MKKICTIVGARPQFVKAAAFSATLAGENQDSRDCQEIIIHTGQHFDSMMSDVFFEQMAIPKPKYNLNINGSGHGKMTGKMIEGLEELFQKENPDLTLVYGDTNSTLAAAIAASKLKIPIAHIEAGLRSFNMSMPEEVNRVLTDRVSTLLFCPTQTAVDNLRREGIPNINSHNGIPCIVENTGDIMFDAVRLFSDSKLADPSISSLLKPSGKQMLVTLHRQENVDNREKLSEIVRSLNELSQEVEIVFPMHPRTAKRLSKFGLKLEFKTIEPMGYVDLLQLLNCCGLVLTDSGGLQKEAYFSGKPCLIVRDETEWVELVEQGVARICGANFDKILASFHQMYGSPVDTNTKLFGNGRAGEKILSSVRAFLKA